MSIWTTPAALRKGIVNVYNENFFTDLSDYYLEWQLLQNGIGRKSKVTAVLSVLFLSVVLTGFALLGIEGAGSPVGQCHFWAGIVTTVLSIGHILKRLPLLRKSLK